MNTKAAFSLYISQGFKPILLAPKSKKPILKQWNKNYDARRYNKILQVNTDYNIGFLLGDVVDIEGDNQRANNFLNDLFCDIPHPIFTSFKSTHHLFKVYKGFSTTRFHKKGIEIRAKYHQSVVPPSIHAEDDTKYEWIFPSDHVSCLPIFTKELENAIFKFCNINKEFVKKDHVRIFCSVCKNKKYGHNKRINAEIVAFKKIGLKWSCNSCRTICIKDNVRKIRKLNYMDC